MPTPLSRRRLIGRTALSVGAALGLTGCAALSPYPIPDPDRPGIHHVTLYVSDLERSARFYVEAFGCRRVYDWRTEQAAGAGGPGPLPVPGVFLDTGDGSLIALRPLLKQGQPGGAGSALQMFALRVPDTRASYSRAIDAGAQPHVVQHDGQSFDGTPTTINLAGDPPASATIAFVAGPDGEVIELFQSAAFIRPTDAPIEPAPDYDPKAPGRL